MGDSSSGDFGKLVGGHPAVDFVNTVGARVTGEGRSRRREYADVVDRERLVSYAALLRWGKLAGVLEASEAGRLRAAAEARPAEAAAVLRRAVALREGLYRIFKASLEGWQPESDDVATLNRELRNARAHERLAGAPPFAWSWEAGDADLDLVLWPIVRAAAELLTSAELERVGQCPGESCGWLFVDRSRAGRRKWCDMADCGNRAKVSRHRQRRARG